jgi:4-aminobutyrate aminotransferase-like enzyme
VLAFEGGYHGLTLGSLAVTSRALFRRPFVHRVYPGVVFAPFPTRRHATGPSADACLERVAEALRSGAPNGDAIGAVVVEPVQGRGGARVAPDGFMSALSALAAEAGALVVADEVLTGMGRCGPMLASGSVGLTPDLVCVGKALGAGMPLSACMARPEVMDSWPVSGGEAIHTSSFLGHPLACAAALAALDQVGPEPRAAAVAERGARLRERLVERLEGIAAVGDVVGMGLLLGIELVAGDGGAPAEAAAARVATRALAKGVIVLPAGDQSHVVELTPALTVTDDQMNFAVDVLGGAIESEMNS